MFSFTSSRSNGNTLPLRQVNSSSSSNKTLSSAEQLPSLDDWLDKPVSHELLQYYYFHKQKIEEFYRKWTKTKYSFRDMVIKYSLLNPYITYLENRILCKMREDSSAAVLMPHANSIRSLCDLIILLKAKVSFATHRNSVIHFLRFISSLDDKRPLTDLEYELIVDVHEAYIDALNFNTIEIGTLSILCIDLKILLTRCEQKVVAVLHKLIVNHEDVLKEKLVYVSFICDRIYDSFAQINETINKAIDEYHEETDPVNLIKEYIKICSQLEDTALKFFFLSLIRRLIIESTDRLYSSDGQIEPWVTFTIQFLLLSAKTSDELIKLAVARCLGEFGAIDYGRLSFTDSSQSKDLGQIFHWDTTEESFRISLINRIGGKLKNNSTNHQAVIHVLTQLFKDLQMKTKDRAYLSLDDEVKALCAQLFAPNSSSQLKEVVRREEVTSPIFNPERPYINWLRLWSTKMLDIFEEKGSYPFFRTLEALLVTDIPFLEDMLPCIIFNFISNPNISDATKRAVIVDEINAIVESALPASRRATFDCSSAVNNQVSITSVILTETQHMCAQRIFVVFDCLTLWMKEEMKELGSQHRNECFKTLFGSIDDCSMAYLAYGCRAYTRSLRYLEEYLQTAKNKITPVCALLFQRIYIALEEPDGVSGVKTIRNAECDLLDDILFHEANNRFQDALSCCEKGVKAQPDLLDHHKNMIRCLMSLGQTECASYYAKGLVNSKPDWKDKVDPYMATCAWQLGHWDELNTIVENAEKNVTKCNIGMNISKLLNCIIIKDDSFLQLLDEVTKKVMHPITAAVSETSPYERCYPHLVHLQQLNEIRSASSILHSFCPDSSLTPYNETWLRTRWIRRNEYVQPSMRTLEPILSLQRALLSMGPSEQNSRYRIDIATSWLESAKLSRKSGCLQRAYNCLLEVNSILPNIVKDDHDLQFVASFYTEFAKYHWACGDKVSKEAAIKCLDSGLQKYFTECKEALRINPATIRSPNKSISCSQRDQQAYHKLRLLQAKFYEESSLQNTRVLISTYKTLMTEDKRSEKVAFQLARLCEKISNSHFSLKIDNANYMVEAIEHYKTSLSLGIKYVYEALPRLLELWFNLGTISSLFETAKQCRGTNANRSNEYIKYEREIRESFSKATDFVMKLKTDVHPYALYTALSQMLSRLNHTHKKVQDTLRSLIATILVKHPHETSWAMFGVLLDTDSNTLVTACNRIIDTAKLATPEPAKICDVTKKLIDQLLPFIGIEMKKSGAYKLGEGELKAFKLTEFINSNKDQILIPGKKFLRAVMPSPEADSSLGYQAFSTHVYIHSIKNEVTVYNSLAKPRKITFVGTDGKEYPFLAKPKDDLRRDSRVMEYFDLFNRLLAKDAETRKRNLRIRTYAVIPFGAASGLIEFVDGMRDIRSLLFKEYKCSKNGGFNPKSLEQFHPGKDGKENAAHNFRKYVTEFCRPPVFWKWFTKEYPHPTAWHQARLNFTRSLALMSIVGYIIGLGDRHFENMLIELETGTVVHVDFALIFNNGILLASPERVPFRLTHNLVDAMGITGLEGHFRRTCEEVLRVARNNLDPILSILTPFVYDPLVGYKFEPKSTQHVQGGAKSKRSIGKNVQNINTDGKMKKFEEALANPKSTIREIVEKLEYDDMNVASSINAIEERLKGLYRTQLEMLKAVTERTNGENADPRPLSINGQVNALIYEALDEENLARMFFGWAPYL